MYSQLEICNRALRLVGEPIIPSLYDQTQASEECLFLYPIVKREVIDFYPWSCTRKSCSLYRATEDDYTNKNGYTNRFLLPFDCINVISVNDKERFKKEGIYLYSNSSKVNLLYTADIDETYIDIRLAKAIALKLAVELSFYLKLDNSITTRIGNLAEVEIKRLMQLDTTEGSGALPSIDIRYSDDWIQSRL